jgi:DNA mismatch repair protein MutS
MRTQAQVDLFAPPPARCPAEPSAVERRWPTIDPDSLSPREALDALYAAEEPAVTT